MASLRAHGNYPVIIAQQRFIRPNYVEIIRRAWRSDRRILQSIIKIHASHRFYSGWRLYGRMSRNLSFRETHTTLSMDGWRILQYTPLEREENNVSHRG